MGFFTKSSSTAGGGERVWAKGVGTSFEFLNDGKRWEPITDKYVIDQLGRLCAHNTTSEVRYDGRANGQKYKTVQTEDGMLVQTNVATNVQRTIRLVPFFFEFEEGPRDWKPVVDPEALMSLTAVLASSINKRYKYKSQTTHDHHEAEASLIGAKGLIMQRNVSTQKQRRIRATPVGPDGAPHFEFLDAAGWAAVSDVCVKQLAACAAGRGEAHYSIKHKVGPASGHTFKYHVRLGDDGFLVQTNVETKKERDVRPAPWLGHGTSADPEGYRVRADPTNGYYRGRPEGEGEGEGEGCRECVEGLAQMMSLHAVETSEGVPVQQPVGTSSTTTTTTTTTVTMNAMPAAQFYYVPEAVPMGTAAAPLMLEESEQMAVPVGPPIYYYQPSVMEPADPGNVPMAHPV